MTARIASLGLLGASLSFGLACQRERGEESRAIAAKYETYCASCHETGAANAPRRGDAASWEVRLRRGKEAVVASAVEGPTAMPAKGGCVECSEADIAKLVDYLAR